MNIKASSVTLIVTLCFIMLAGIMYTVSMPALMWASIISASVCICASIARYLSGQ